MNWAGSSWQIPFAEFFSTFTNFSNFFAKQNGWASIMYWMVYYSCHSSSISFVAFQITMLFSVSIVHPTKYHILILKAPGYHCFLVKAELVPFFVRIFMRRYHSQGIRNLFSFYGPELQTMRVNITKMSVRDLQSTQQGQPEYRVPRGMTWPLYGLCREHEPCFFLNEINVRNRVHNGMEHEMRQSAS
jgi:hypothetical protein